MAVLFTDSLSTADQKPSW